MTHIHMSQRLPLVSLATVAAGTLAALSGCEGLTSTAQPLVSVLKATTDDCFSLITTGTPVASVIDLAGLCSYTSAPKLLAGVDFNELVIDYGPDVQFSGSTAAPPPTITFTIDGTVTAVPVTLSSERRVGSRAFFVGTFRTPTQPTSNMQITAGVNAGFQTTVPDVFTVLPPPVELTMLDCAPSSPCVLAGAVGSAHVRVTVPGTVPQTVLLHTSIDGVAQPDTLPPVVTSPVLGQTEQTTAIEVPTAHDGALWTITAQLGTNQVATIDATIQAPSISSALSCGDTCNIATGDIVGLEVTAPALIRPLTALVTTRIAGVPQLVAAPVTLIENSDGTATGLIALTAPTTPGVWEIDASVAGYAAAAVIATVH